MLSYARNFIPPQYTGLHEGHYRADSCDKHLEVQQHQSVPCNSDGDLVRAEARDEEMLTDQGFSTAPSLDIVRVDT